MWGFVLWLAGVGTAALSILFIVLIIKRKNISKKVLLLVKYVLIASAPLTWGIGVMVAGAQNVAGRDKAATLMMVLLMLAVTAAFLGDIRKDI